MGYNIINKIKTDIIDNLKNSIKKAVESGEFKPDDIPEVFLEVPKEEANGNFSCTVSMHLAKALRQAPRKIAENIVKNLDENEYVEKVQIAGAGFINFYLNDKYLYESLKEAIKEGENYGRTNVGNGKKVMVEFISSNPTGPMHMGNARGGALGDAIAEVLSWSGYKVTREFYLNDAGNQIEKFKKSLSIRYQQLLGVEIELPEDCYQGEDIKDHARNFIEEYGDEYLNKDEKERETALCEYALPKNIARIKSDLEAYRIYYDTWFSEKSLYESGEIYKTIDYLKEKGYTYEKDGSVWFKATEFGLEKDEVIVRNNGIPTYLAGDIAYHRNKFVTRGFDKVIDVWGADHHGHVARMKKAMDAIGCNGDNLEVVLMQLVRLLRGGEIVKMSKRSGKAITLSDLLDEVGVDAARFFFNMRSYSSHFDFDLDLAVQQSNENPVFYVQYAHARICSILKQLREEGIFIPEVEEVKFDLLKADAEKELMKKLSMLPEEIKTSAETFDPSKMTRYVMDLSALFHSFYNSCRVKGVEEELMKARILLIEGVKIAIKNTLNILGVTAPESM